MTNRSSAVKLGLIGCGRVAETRHLPALLSLSDVEVIAVADVDPDRLRRVGELFHVRRRYKNYLDLLGEGQIDAVAVCVPAQFHVEVALAALDAGKHVFIEKPLALGMDESNRLVERAKKSSSKVMVGFNLRWHRLVRQARRLIQQGTLGSLQLVRTVLTSFHDDIPEWRKCRATGGGVLFEQAVHHFDLWHFLLESEVVELCASTQSTRWEDEAAVVTARMANGVIAASTFSERASDRNEVEIYGQGGCLRVSCYRFDGLEFFSTSSAPGDIRTRLRRIAHALIELPQAARNLRQGGDFVASYRAEWRHFLDSIRQDTPVECTLEDGRAALAVTLAALESVSLGRSVRVSKEPAWVAPRTASGFSAPGIKTTVP